MSSAQNVKIVVFVPESHADLVRDAAGRAGAGKIGNYTYCSFTTKGVGRYIPTGDAKPMFGIINKLEQVNEEKIEFLCERNIAKAVIEEIKKVHPYDEIAYDVFPIEDIR